MPGIPVEHSALVSIAERKTPSTRYVTTESPEHAPLATTIYILQLLHPEI